MPFLILYEEEDVMVVPFIILESQIDFLFVNHIFCFFLICDPAVTGVGHCGSLWRKGFRPRYDCLLVIQNT